MLLQKALLACRLFLCLTLSMQGVAAILLAAGQSRRMGAFKPLLPFGAKTVIDSCLDYLKEGGVETIVVVVGHRAHDIRQHLRQTDVRFALNPDPTSEMGASISAGVEVLPETTQAVLIGLVDHPAVPASIVSTLTDEWSKGGKIVIPTWSDRGGHPVLVDMSLKEDLLKLDRQGGLRQLFVNHEQDVVRNAVESPFVARDMDTWDDYCRLHEEVFGEPPHRADETIPTKR
jgi:molybdenum cofactor cytidylyltransferase